MTKRQRYRKRAEQFVIPVRVKLETAGFTYEKWGAQQRCKQGDWLVDNDGDIYTVDNEVFTRTYDKVNPGMYVKATPIWAEVADKEGSAITKEGESQYKEGDYLVSNNEDGSDAYCISRAKFESMYELDE